MKAINIIILLFISLNVCATKIVYLRSDRSLQAQLSQENTTYVLNFNYSLKNSVLSLPYRSNLSFSEEGVLSNGTIIGNKSEIIACRKLIFKDITLKGSWNNSTVYSEWINFKSGKQNNNSAFSNLMTLCNGDKLTHFYMQEDTFYVSAIDRSAPILIPSNVYWHNKSTIKMLPTNLEWYNIVLIEKADNITIDGGFFIGDLFNHIGNSGEWGHGIKCAGATNISLKNLTTLYCWGDGIDLIEAYDENNQPTINCNNIIVDSVQCIYNRRQGMSIEAASNVSVTNSIFAFTGQIKRTLPSCGLDIEPWTDNGKKVSNITLSKCTMHSNLGYDIQISGNFRRPNEKIYNGFCIEDCKLNTMYAVRTNGLKIENTTILSELSINNIKNVNIKVSDIKKISKGYNIKSLIIHYK